MSLLEPAPTAVVLSPPRAVDGPVRVERGDLQKTRGRLDRVTIIRYGGAWGPSPRVATTPSATHRTALAGRDDAREDD